MLSVVVIFVPVRVCAIGVADNDYNGDLFVVVFVIVEPLVAPFFTAMKVKPRRGWDEDDWNAQKLTPVDNSDNNTVIERLSVEMWMVVM